MNQNKNIPTPLQNQILLQTAASAVSLVIAAALCINFGPCSALPFLVLAAVSAICAARLRSVVTQGRYIALHAAVLKVEKTSFLRRPKALLCEADGRVLRVVLKSRLCKAAKGEHIVIYILDTTPIFEWRGIHTLSSYLACVPHWTSGT